MLLKNCTFHETKLGQQNMVSEDHFISIPKFWVFAIDDVKNLTSLRDFKVKWINLQTVQNLHLSSR